MALLVPQDFLEDLALMVCIAAAVVPDGDEPLRENDVVELIGPLDAVEAVARMLAPNALAPA